MLGPRSRPLAWPGSPLRHWRLIDVGSGSSLVTSPLRIDERILHYLVGIDTADDRLAGLIYPVMDEFILAPSQAAVAERIRHVWSTWQDGLPALVQLCGTDRVIKRAVARLAAGSVGLGLCRLDALALPSDPRELSALVRLWEREALLSRQALLLECDGSDGPDAAREQAISQFLATCRSALLLSSVDPRPQTGRPSINLDVERPTTQEQRTLWGQLLGASGGSLNGTVDQLAAQFNLNGPEIVLAAQVSVEPSPDGQSGDLAQQAESRLWNACRVQARPRLHDLAQRVANAATWDDLVLPELQMQTLRDIAAHVRQRARVYETWGFAQKSNRGLGISALFAGASGTGKTLAAEVLANELNLDLYRIDLSQVVSKYIGETEKNLRRVFDAAESGGAVLLFDEADALFGKRSEVKDSHDRYANIEVSYLLQRMEAYRGLAILTTNMKSALDSAFLRRIRFIVNFPFPDAGQRAEIWRRIFPPATPTDGLDAARLARLNVAGGNIRNIALNAAFLAADAREPVRMQHLLRAAKIEYAKLEKTLSTGEVGDWT